MGMSSIDVMCTNGNIPSSMNIGAPDGDFDCDIDIANLRITALNRPSRMLPAMALKGMNWRIISQLSLNFVLLSGTDGAMKLRNAVNIILITIAQYQFILNGLKNYKSHQFHPVYLVYIRLYHFVELILKLFFQRMHICTLNVSCFVLFLITFLDSMLL